MQPLYQGNHRFKFRTVSSLDYRVHLQNSLELVFLLEGSCHTRCGGVERQLEQGQLLAVFPNQIHSYDSSRDVRAVLLIVPPQPFLAAYADTLFRMAPVEPRMETGDLMPLLEMMLRDQKDMPEPVMQGYLQVLVGKLLQRMTLSPVSGSPNDTLHKLLLWLETHYTEPLSRQTLARELGYSEGYLSHIFSEALGTTMPTYVNTLRIRKAMELLRRESVSISDAALELGFGSIRSFNRAFRKETGMTPAKWRKM